MGLKAQASEQLGSMNRTDLEWIVWVDDGGFIAVSFAEWANDLALVRRLSGGNIDLLVLL